MKIGIIDAELISGKKHRFPNLACMKLSAYHKKTNDVELILKYEDGGAINLISKRRSHLGNIAAPVVVKARGLWRNLGKHTPKSLKNILI